MYRALCVAVLLMTTMAAAQESQSSSPNTVVSPVIVAKGKWLNQTDAIPTTTIFTPKQTGLFRLSIYGTVVALIQNGGTVQVNVGWTDDSGPQDIPILNAPPGLGQFDTSLGGYFFYGYPMGGPVITFEAITGQPITFSVNDYGALPNTYSIYYTLERLG